MPDLAWIIINVLLLILFLIGFGVALVCASENEPGVAGVVTAGTVIVVGGLLFFNNFPFDMQYHSWNPVEGKVANIDKRQVASGDGFEEKFAIRFEGDAQIYGCSDTRCSLAKKGNTVKLNCIRTWQYASVPGYDCRYNQ